MDHQHDTFTCNFSWRLDRDENGVCADAELTQSPDWMSAEARALVERDLSREVLRASRGRKVAA